MLIKMKIAQSVSILLLLTAFFSSEMKAQLGLSLNNKTNSQSAKSSNKYSLLLNKKFNAAPDLLIEILSLVGNYY